MSRKLRILYHHRTQGRGAEGTHIAHIVHAFQRMGHDVTVLSPPGVDPLGNIGAAPVDKSKVKTSGVQSLWKFISKHVPGVLFELVEIAYNVPAAIRLGRELRAGQYDLVYERYAFFLIAGAWQAKRYGVPLALEANEVNGLEERARRQILRRLCGVFERYLFRRCKAIFTVSSYLRDMILAQGVEPDHVHVTPNAINIDEIGTLGTEDLRKQYGLKDKLVIGFAGWFDHWDRLDLLVEVAHRLHPDNDKLRVLLVGDGPVMKEIRKRIDQYGLQEVFVLTGAVPRAKIFDYLSLLDVAVFSHSNQFGSPVILFELMGLKVPVVAPRLPPIVDVLEHGKTGMLFEPLDVNGLEHAVRSLLASRADRDRQAQAAYTNLLQHHTWDANGAQILGESGLGDAVPERRSAGNP